MSQVQGQTFATITRAPLSTVITRSHMCQLSSHLINMYELLSLGHTYVIQDSLYQQQITCDLSHSHNSRSLKYKIYPVDMEMAKMYFLFQCQSITECNFWTQYHVEVSEIPGL
jgi:hypothetical protein